MKVSSPSLVRGRIAARLAAWAIVACALAACAGREQEEEERAKRARQMRDVSRMLDAMETDKPAAAPPAPFMVVPADAPVSTIPVAPARAQAPRKRSTWPLFAVLAIALSGGLAITAAAIVMWRRRKRAALPRAEAPSIAACFATSRTEGTQRPAPPTWAYRSSSFETPGIHVLAEPVDLLPPATPARPPARSGDWQACVAAARTLARREADVLLAAAESEALAALADAAGEGRSAILAQLLRIRLARAEKLSGATRLFAVRNLLTAIAGDPDADRTAVLDARIDAQLAWSSWVFGEAVATRLMEAEKLCERMASGDAAARARAARRRGEVCLRRAQLLKAPVSLWELDRAQALLDEAHAQAADAETALLIAQTALRRARLSAPDVATEACSHALVHAFLAEQDPACRTEALACRLDIQLAYESLPECAARHGVMASLGRSLEASGPLSPAARVAIAEMHLREGNHAKAAGLCESVWREGYTERHVLELWRNACRRWAAAEGQDARALAQSRRRLAIARSTL